MNPIRQHRNFGTSNGNGEAKPHLKSIYQQRRIRAATVLSYMIVVSTFFTLSPIAMADAAGDHQHHHSGDCLDGPARSVMFMEALSDAAHSQLRDSHPTLSAPRFQLQDSRWTSTATHPSISPGDSFFITYSFVPDGTSIPASFWCTNPGAEPSILITSMNSQFPGGMDGFRAEAREMFDAWEEVTNIRFVEVADDGVPFVPANIGLLASATRVGRGDIRIAMRNIDGANGVVIDDDGTVRNVAAYIDYPATGADMVLDSGTLGTFVNPVNDFRGLKNILGHEIGHGLGIMHVMPQNGTKLMEPGSGFANGNPPSFDGPQEDDIRAVAHAYGDFVEPNDTLETATPIGSIALNASTQIQTNFELSLERRSSVDFFKFSASADIGFQVTVEPIGTTYQEGPQPPAFPPNIPVVLNTVNGAAVRDLRLTVYHGNTAIGLADENPAGFAETVDIQDAPGSGVYTIRISSNDQLDEPQRYQLIVTRDDQPQIRVFAQTNPAEEVESGGSFAMGSANTETSLHLDFKINNAGAGTLAFSNNPHVTIFGENSGDFVVNVQPSQASLEPGEETLFNIGFQPSGLGIRSATVLISSNDPDEGAFMFTVLGNGLATTNNAPIGEPEIRVFQVTPTYVFGKVEVQDGGLSDVPDLEVGEDSFVFYFIENHGDSDLILSGDVEINRGDSDFSILSQTTGFPIPAGNPSGFADNFRIRFSPSEIGLQTATILIDSNAPGAAGQFVFTLRGRGIERIDDCNANGFADEEDLAEGLSEDCNANGIPDECDPDSDGDGVPDTCDACDGLDDLIDSDGDGTIDCLDGCPNDPFKLDPGDCGCDREETSDCGIGVCPDGDDDGDSVCNAQDLCPGENDLQDSDFDGTVDCLDGCPQDPFKTEPGDCGCNRGETDDCATNTPLCAEGDDDGDGICNSEDQCPGQNDLLDRDDDGRADGCDICPESADHDDVNGNGTPDCAEDVVETDPGGAGEDEGTPTDDGTPTAGDEAPTDGGTSNCKDGLCGAGCAMPMMLALAFTSERRRRRRHQTSSF